MANTAADVVVGFTGGLNFAPLATVLPVDATTALGVGFLEVGYLTEAGVVQSEGESQTKIKAWQGGDVVRILTTEHSLTFKFEMMETNPNSLGLFYGDNYVAGTVEIKGGVKPHHAFVIEVMDGTSHIRIAIDDAQITERGDISYVNSDAVTYPVTIECFPNAEGVKATVFYETAGIPGA